MNTDSRIRELVRAHLSDDHEVHGVEFMDELLTLAAQVGEIRCSLAGGRALRFQTSEQPAWEVELGRAKSKLRMLCARLGVLCNESDGPKVSLYGGEGIIKRMAPGSLSTILAGQAASTAVGLTEVGGPAVVGSTIEMVTPNRPSMGPEQWAVRFKNTPSEQEFIIQAQ